MFRSFNLVSPFKVQQKSLPFYEQKDKIQYNGEDNLKPLRTEEAFYNSPVAKQCAGTYKSHLKGKGFDVDNTINLSLYDFEPYSINDLLGDICHSVSKHGGAFVHVTYDANYKKKSFKVLPYKDCRISLTDDTGYIRHIVYKRNGWYNTRTQTTKRKDKVEIFPSYNPNELVLEEQFKAYNGISNHPGQVYYIKIEKDFVYTDGYLESVIELAFADGLLNILTKNRVSGGFQNVKFLRHSKSLSEADVDNLEEQLRSALGAKNANSILRVADDITDVNPEGSFKIESIGDDVPADTYSHFEDKISDKIRRAYLNIPHQLIEATPGKLASSSELKEAIAIYNTFTANDRDTIQQKMHNLFTNFEPAVELGDIRLFSLLEDGSITPNDTAQVQAQQTLNTILDKINDVNNKK